MSQQRSALKRLWGKPKSQQRRVAVIITLALALSSLLCIRLIDLQVVRADQLSSAASEFRSRSYTLHAKRGDILDSEGAILATSIERYNVGVNQKKIAEYIRRDKQGKVLGTGAAQAAKDLAPVLGMDEAELGGKLLGGEKKSTFVYLVKDISPEKWRDIAALRIPGIEPEQYMKRTYPNHTIAGNILGYVGENEGSTPGEVTGQAGIEKSENAVLTGKNGSLSVEVGGGGAVLPSGDRVEVAPQDGADVKLTINRDLQNALQTAVNESVSTHGGEWGAAVVMEIGTNRVLALVDSNSPDPANLAGVGAENWGSRAVSTPVEPGSTGKLVTFSAAIDQGTVTPTTVFPAPYSITMPNGQSIHDNNEHPAQNLTVAGILAKSYNTGLIQIGDTISDDLRFDYMKKFGLGSKTGIELPAESAGILREPSTWDPRTHYTTMFGQAWALTTVQLGGLVSTIGNKGVWVQPHIVDSVISPDGTQTPTLTQEPHRVMSEQSAATMLEMMQAVTQPGSTGALAAVPGYNIAGKTGTAQVADGRGGLTKRVGTFAGVVPAENPQIAVAVVIYNAGGPGYGGSVAAPVFRDVTSFAVRQLKIPPSTVPLVRLPWAPGEIANN